MSTLRERLGVSRSTTLRDLLARRVERTITTQPTIFQRSEGWYVRAPSSLQGCAWNAVTGPYQTYQGAVKRAQKLS